MAERTLDRIAETSPTTEGLEQLADETGCAAEVVQNLYEGEYQLLQRDARVGNYIAVLALKRVRDLLRRYDPAQRHRDQ